MKRSSRLNIAAALLVLFLFSLGFGLNNFYAQADTPSPSTAADDRKNPLQYNTIKESFPRSRFDPSKDGTTKPVTDAPITVLTDFLNLATLVIATLAIIGLIISGMMFIAAGQEEEKARMAKNNVIYIITGIVIYMAAYWFIVVGGEAIKKYLNLS